MKEAIEAVAIERVLFVEHDARAEPAVLNGCHQTVECGEAGPRAAREAASIWRSSSAFGFADSYANDESAIRHCTCSSVQPRLRRWR